MTKTCDKCVVTNDTCASRDVPESGLLVDVDEALEGGDTCVSRECSPLAVKDVLSGVLKRKSRVA